MEALTMETRGWLLDQIKKLFPELEAETREALIRRLEAPALSEEALEARVLSVKATCVVLGWEWLLALSGEGLRAVMAALREALEALSGEALSEALSGEALEALLEALRRARRQALWEAPREARLKALLESGLQARREAELDAWLRRCYDIFKPCKLEEGAPALTKELIEERIRYLESVEERRREEALVRRSSFLFSDYRSPDRDISIIPYQYAAQVPDFWSCSLGSERTLGYPRVYGKDLKDYVEQVPDSPSGDSERTLYPYVMGTSVLAVKFRDGILMAADMGGSYGSTLRYKTIEQIKPIGKHSLVGASGEISDFQEILRYLDELMLYYNRWDDGNSLGPKELHNYLTRVMYNRWNKFSPLWNSLVLGGVKNGQKYLGMVSMMGVSFEENHVATGFGNHLARPILCDEWNENLSFEDAVKLLEKCMRVLLYRDRSAVNKLQIVKITEEGATNFPPYSLKTFWGFESYENPTVGEEGHHLKMTN